MFEAGYIFHYGTALLITAFPALCAALGQAESTKKAFEARRIQPNAEQEISGLMVIGNALIETSALLGLLTGFMLLATPQTSGYLYWINISHLGILAAMGLTGSIVAYMSSYPIQAAITSLARQPFFSKKIQIFTIIMQSIMQTPIIMAFLIAITIKNQSIAATSLNDSLRLIGAGLAIGLGSIGPTIGLGLFLQKACTSLGINRFSYPKIISFSFMSEAMIGASVIFSLLVSLFILGSSVYPSNSLMQGLGYLAAGLCMGLGTLGVGLGLGKIASKVSEAIGNNPGIHGDLSKTSIIAQALIEAQTIYAFIIALRILKNI